MPISDLANKVIGDKRRWRQYQARVKAMPENYRTAVEAIERYALRFGPSDGGTLATMLEDLAELFEHAVADGTAIRDIVGSEPVEFVDAFLASYTKGSWVTKERDRLTSAIERAESATGAAGADD